MHIPVAPDALLQFCVSCFQKLGLPLADAHITAQNLIFANLRGVDSHGVIRMKIYADRIRAGGIRPGLPPRLLAEQVSSGVLDAGDGVGQVAGETAMRLAIGKAENTGAGIIAVRNSNHFGAAAFYAMKALDLGMIGLAATNAGPTMAPTGGRERRLGNNPLAIAIPAGRHPPLILDMATGAVAWGKIFLAQQENKKIPLSWALDKAGAPTDDPNAAADQGLIQPFGGYKGYGLSLVIDVLTGLLSGGGFSTRVQTLYQNLGQPSQIAHMCAALKIEAFMPLDDFKAKMDELIDLMHACATAPGVDRIYVPGEIEHETEQRRKKEGIPLNKVLAEELRGLAKEMGVATPF